jgi:hypothetical protein
LSRYSASKAWSRSSVREAYVLNTPTSGHEYGIVQCVQSTARIQRRRRQVNTAEYVSLPGAGWET